MYICTLNHITILRNNLIYISHTIWDSKSKTKVKRFAKYFPKEKLVIIDGKFFNSKETKILLAHIEGLFKNDGRI